MTFPMTKKNKKPHSQLTFIAQAEIQAFPKEKRRRNVNDVPNDKKKTKKPPSQLTFIAQAEIQAFPKEKKKKER